MKLIQYLRAVYFSYKRICRSWLTLKRGRLKVKQKYWIKCSKKMFKNFQPRQSTSNTLSWNIILRANGSSSTAFEIPRTAVGTQSVCNNFGCLRYNLHWYHEIALVLNFFLWRYTWTTKFAAHFSLLSSKKSSENVRVSAKNCLYSFSIPSLLWWWEPLH